MKRVMLNCCIRALKQPWLLLCLTTLLVTAPRNARAANFCVAVSGGFGPPALGETFVGEGFTSPTSGTCKPWAGIMKSNTTVVWTSTGAACLSNDGKLLTIVLQSTDPSFNGNGSVTDTIELCRVASNCPVSSFDYSSLSGFGGPAAQVTCTTKVTSIPSMHD